MNQRVETSRIGKVVEGLKLAFYELTVNSEIKEQTGLEDLVKEIRSSENKDFIAGLEKSTTSVYIPLEDKGAIVDRAKVSEKLAREIATEKVKDGRKKSNDGLIK